MALAIFDLDETLISADSDHEWGEYIASQGLVDADDFRLRNDAFYADYKKGNLDVHAYLTFACEVLRKQPRALLEQHRQTFVEKIIQPRVLPGARELVEHHRNRGDRLLVITSTNRFVTEPIVSLFGIDTLIAPEPEILDGRYTGQVIGVPSFGVGKVTRLDQWLEEQSESYTRRVTWFYSDSHNDLPLLRSVGHPIAVDPDETLRQYAKDAGWQIISLRD